MGAAAKRLRERAPINGASPQGIAKECHVLNNLNSLVIEIIDGFIHFIWIYSGYNKSKKHVIVGNHYKSNSRLSLDSKRKKY